MDHHPFFLQINKIRPNTKSLSNATNEWFSMLSLFLIVGPGVVPQV